MDFKGEALNATTQRDNREARGQKEGRLQIYEFRLEAPRFNQPYYNNLRIPKAIIIKADSIQIRELQ